MYFAPTATPYASSIYALNPSESAQRQGRSVTAYSYLETEDTEGDPAPNHFGVTTCHINDNMLFQTSRRMCRILYANRSSKTYIVEKRCNTDVDRVDPALVFVKSVGVVLAISGVVGSSAYNQTTMIHNLAANTSTTML